MKPIYPILIVILFFILLTFLYLFDNPDFLEIHHKLTLQNEFESFKKTYNRSYRTRSEELRRRRIFVHNFQLISLENAKADRGEKSYYLGVNKFADLTRWEFCRLYLGYRSKRVPKRTSKTHQKPLPQTPDQIDWTQRGVVTPVKDQGQCGSCWAFSTVAAIEAAHAIASGQLISLSEQNLVDCSTANHGCDGGNVDLAFEYVIQNGGIDTEDSYEYQAVQQDCQYDPSSSGATISSYQDLPSGDKSSLQNAVATVGPVSVAINADRLQFYTSGVYDDPDCDPDHLDHAVTVVGYGTTEDGIDFWKVKNSWGAGWGEDGYVRMKRNADNQCGIASEASYPIS